MPQVPAPKPGLATVREIMFDGPEPPQGQQFCMMCATRYKADVLEAAKDVIEAAQSTPGEGAVRLAMDGIAPGTAPPELAVGIGISQAFGGAMMPLCWSHLGAVKFTSLAVAQATGGLVPGRR